MARRGMDPFALAWFDFSLELVPLQSGWDNSLTVKVYPGDSHESLVLKISNMKIKKCLN